MTCEESMMMKGSEESLGVVKDKERKTYTDSREANKKK